MKLYGKINKITFTKKNARQSQNCQNIPKKKKKWKCLRKRETLDKTNQPTNQPHLNKKTQEFFFPKNKKNNF